MNKEIYEMKRYFGMALDPIHIGTGGYRLGRVDNTIVREPGTNLPKIPGTSIEGCARTYAYYEELNPSNRNGYKEPTNACATGKENACGKCRVCVTFGYTNVKDRRIKIEDGGKEIEKEIPQSLHGLVQFSDARILFFPVYSMIGPVWITCPSILKEFGIEAKVEEEKIKTKLNVEKLNLGWIYLEKKDNFEISPDKSTDKFSEIPIEIKEKVVLVSDKLFSQIVNSNLEVRTSVSINPETGAAEEGALFTYEAIPRATVFWFEVVYLDPNLFECYIEKGGKAEKLSSREVLQQVVAHGLKLFEILGVGGMGTRGFGRLKILNLR